MPLSLAEPRLRGRLDQIVDAADVGQDARGDDPAGDVLLVDACRNIVRLYRNRIRRRRIAFVSLLRLQVRIALAAAVLDVGVGGHRIVEARVERPEIRTRQHLGVAGAQLKALADLQACAGVGQEVGIAGAAIGRNKVVVPPRLATVPVPDGPVGLGDADTGETVNRIESLKSWPNLPCT